MYVFKVFLGFTAAALVLPLAVMDLGWAEQRQHCKTIDHELLFPQTHGA